MADALSVLGAAVGVTSLIGQIADGCIKGFKVYSEAVNMPENYRYLRVLLQIEQQRFLNFGMEAGIFYADGTICTTLQINRTLLLAILAEIKALLESYATMNGSYEEFTSKGDVDWDDKREPEMELMELLFLPPRAEKEGSGETSGEKYRNRLKRFRALGERIAQTGRKLRLITVEPKRLVWGAIDKEAFACLISKLGELNSFLIGLLDSSQLRRIEETLNTTYLEMLQVRNDLESLTNLVKAFAPTANNQRQTGVASTGSENSSLSQTIVHEMEAQEEKKKYLKQLAEIKIECTKMDHLSGETSLVLDGLFSPLLNLDDFGFTEEVSSHDIGGRADSVYQGGSVWVEWKHTSVSSGLRLRTEQVENRIRLLTNLLCYRKPEGFRAPPCIGYVKMMDSDEISRFGIAFQKPQNADVQSKLLTLRELLGRTPKPSLSSRISLCAVLARCIHSFHAVNWLHKGLRSDSIIFFASSPERTDLDSPYVSGFELSRPSIIGRLTEKPDFNPLQDIYRHPNAQSSQTDGNFRKCYDMYSLGIVVIEIGFWKPIEDIVGFNKLATTGPSALREIQSWLLGRPLNPHAGLPPIPMDKGSWLQQVASECGDAFCNIVKFCLTADEVEMSQYRGESESAVAIRLHGVVKQDIVERMEHIASALQ